MLCILTYIFRQNRRIRDTLKAIIGVFLTSTFLEKRRRSFDKVFLSMERKKVIATDAANELLFYERDEIRRTANDITRESISRDSCDTV